MKRAITCTILLAKSILCSSSPIEDRYIELWTSSFTNPLEESLNNPSTYYSNENITHSNLFNTPPEEVYNHTPEYASALSACPAEQAVYYGYTEAEPMQWEESQLSSTQEPFYEPQSAYYSGYPAQYTNPHIPLFNQYNQSEYSSIEHRIEYPEATFQASTYAPNQNDQTLDAVLDSICENTLNSSSSIDSDPVKEIIEYEQIQQIKRQLEMECQEILDRERPHYTHTVDALASNTPQPEYTPGTACDPNQKTKPAKRKAQATDKNKKKRKKEKGKSKKENKCIPRNWNENSLKDSHRESCTYSSYKPAYLWCIWDPNSLRNRKQKKRLEIQVREYKNNVQVISPNIILLFSISVSGSAIHTKLSRCQYMLDKPNNYEFMKEIHPNYSSLVEYIINFMKKHGPISTDRKEITTEWEETLGDIFVRKTIEDKYLMDSTSTLFADTSGYKLLGGAVHMVLSLSEVYSDLSRLTSEFIEDTLKRASDMSPEDCTVIRALHEIANKSKSAPQGDLEAQYRSLYRVFADILNNSNISLENKVIQLYTRMYAILTHFYSKAKIYRKIVDPQEKRLQNKEEYSVLHGKCILKPQKYLRCTTKINPSSSLREHILQITGETNRWTIKPGIAEHYHIHYVDNTAQRYKRLCMPMYKGTGYVHTIEFIVEYIQRVFGIEEKGCIVPYKRDKTTGTWSNIPEEEMSKTMHNLAGYHVVFYYIEEGLVNNHFTFACFDSYMKPGAETVPIPLFLSPLTRVLTEMGPFEEKDKEKHAVVVGMRFKNRTADIYTYKEEYTGYKYTSIQHYYSNLYIRVTNADTRTIDCYIMDAQTTKNTLIWYVKVPTSVSEYTHCVLDESFRNNPPKYIELINAVYSQEYASDSELNISGLRIPKDASRTDSQHKHISVLRVDYNPNTILCLDRKIVRITAEIKEKEEKPDQSNKIDLKKKMNAISNLKKKLTQLIKSLPIQSKEEKKKIEILKDISLSFCSLLVFRNNNTTKSSLGALNELFDALACDYASFLKFRVRDIQSILPSQAEYTHTANSKSK